MTTLQTADGRLLRAQRPGGAVMTGGMWGSTYPPMWSDGERMGDDGFLKSFEQVYRSQPNLSAVIDKLTRRVATLPFDAYRRLADQEREQLPEDDLLSVLLCKPQPRRSKVHLLAHIQQSMLIHGNALVAKLRGPDREAPPVMLWPLNWSMVSAYGAIGEPIEWWSTHQFGGEEKFFKVEDTLHFAWPNPAGGEIGVSPLEKLGVTLRLEDATMRHQIAQYKNGVRPSLAVTVEGDPKVEKLEYARERVKAMHQGADKGGGVWFMGSNVKVQPLSLSPVEVALIEQRNLSLAEIGRVFDLSGPVMNDLEHGTYSNVQVLLDALYRDVVPVWLGLIEQTIQSQLIDPEPAWSERFTSFDLTDKLKGDPVQLAESLKTQVEAGLITRNEARRILNLPPMDDATADKLTYNANNQAPIDFHRNTEVLSTNPAGTDVNPPAIAPPPVS